MTWTGSAHDENEHESWYDVRSNGCTNLHELCGKWEDTDACTYALWLYDEGTLSVQAIRPSGRARTYDGIICASEGEIIWGSPGIRISYVMRQWTRSSIVWLSTRGDQQYTWRRSNASTRLGRGKDWEAPRSTSQSDAPPQLARGKSWEALGDRQPQALREKIGSAYVQLQCLCGMWQDSKGASYELELDDLGTMWLTLTWASGEAITMPDIVSVSAFDPSQVVWSSGKGVVLILDITSRLTVTWHSPDGQKSFRWERVDEQTESLRSSQSGAKCSERIESDQGNRDCCGSTASTVLLKDLCGSWMDKNGSKYVVTLGENGGLVVKARKPCGKQLDFTGLVRVGEDGTNFVWGSPDRPPGFVLRHDSEHHVCWMNQKKGGRSFKWVRLGPKWSQYTTDVYLLSL